MSNDNNTIDVAKEIDDLYNSELNFRFSAFWDGGIEWALGDDVNGFDADGVERTMTAAVLAVRKAALRFYPDSTYACNRKSHLGLVGK